MVRAELNRSRILMVHIGVHKYKNAADEREICKQFWRRVRHFAPATRKAKLEWRV